VQVPHEDIRFFSAFVRILDLVVLDLQFVTKIFFVLFEILNLLLKQQLFLITRPRKRAPNLSPLDRFLLGLWTIFLDPRRIIGFGVHQAPIVPIALEGFSLKAMPIGSAMHLASPRTRW